MSDLYRQDAAEAYRTACKLGKRALSERHATDHSGLLPVLESIIRDTCGEIPLGCYEVPLKKIVGTFAGGRQSAFAVNFMPLLDDGTEFSVKWQTLFQLNSTEGIYDPIKVYEYLGQYYVVEGHKRVSVSSFVGMYSILAEVTRLLPPFDENNLENAIFYEYIGENKRTVIKHLWFSSVGRVSKLRALADKFPFGEKSEDKAGAISSDPAQSSRAPELAPNDAPKFESPELTAQSLIDDSFFRFRRCYHSIGLSDLPLNTGDAFLEYVLVYGFPIDLTEAALKKNIKTCQPQFEHYISPPHADFIDDPDELTQFHEPKNLFSLFMKSKKLSIGFVFSDAPDSFFWKQAHEAGRFELERQFPSLSVTPYTLGSDLQDEELKDLVKNVDLLFITDQKLGKLALRLALENRNTAVLHCATAAKHSVLPTYYGKPQEPAFLCGVLAGALTRTGSVGYIKGRSATGTLSGDVQAFAQGARSVRPAARVYYRNPSDRTLTGCRSAQAALSQSGCDIVWIPHLPGYAAQRKVFPGAYGHLCGLDPSGVPVRFYATAAYHWGAFYTRLMQTLIDGAQDVSGSSVHFRMGLSTGLLEVHPIYPDLPPWPRRLLTQYHHLISSGFTTVLDETMCVEIIED